MFLYISPFARRAPLRKGKYEPDSKSNSVRDFLAHLHMKRQRAGRLHGGPFRASIARDCGPDRPSALVSVVQSATLPLSARPDYHSAPRRPFCARPPSFQGPEVLRRRKAAGPTSGRGVAPIRLPRVIRSTE